MSHCLCISLCLQHLSRHQEGVWDVYGMDTFILKAVSESVAGPLTHIINSSQSQGRFPESWKFAAVVPVFKGGDPFLTPNYRPINILPTVSKVLKNWLLNKSSTTSRIASVNYIQCNPGSELTTLQKLPLATLLKESSHPCTGGTVGGCLP